MATRRHGRLRKLSARSQNSTTRFARGVWNFTLEDVWQRVESDDPDCFSDDILGECICTYETSFDVTVIFDIELP